MNAIKNMLARFSKDEDGLALTEYLILLGLLTGAVIAAVLLFGTTLGTNWSSWATWIQGAGLGYTAPTP